MTSNCGFQAGIDIPGRRLDKTAAEADPRIGLEAKLFDGGGVPQEPVNILFHDRQMIRMDFDRQP